MAQLSFKRQYELEGDKGVLEITQQGEGDVNCVVWDAALVLAKYLEKRATKNPYFLMNKKVTELGSGLGCVGIVAASLGGNVILTDLPKTMPLLRENIKKNEIIIRKQGGSATPKSLDWVADNETDNCDVLLLADCVYYDESVGPLIQTMIRLSSLDTEIFISQEDRSYSEVQTAVWNRFYQEVSAFFSIREINRCDQHPQFSSYDIKLLLLKKLNNITSQ